MKTISTLIETNKALLKDEEDENLDVHLYRFNDGSLMIFRYLKGQSKLGLWYPRDSPFDLEAFSDSDYVGASLDRKSTTGGCQFLGKRLISWQCKKQTIVANSTTEAEYVAAVNCCGQNPVFHSKTKHIEIRHHFIRDSYEKRLIQVIKIHTDHNVVDLLTKAFDVSRIGVDTARHKLNTSSIKLSQHILILLGKVNTTRLKGLIFQSEGSTILVESHHTPTDAPSTSPLHISPTLRSPIRQETKVPQLSSLPHTHVADEAVSTGVDVRYGGAATTVTSLDAGQDSDKLQLGDRLENRSINSMVDYHLQDLSRSAAKVLTDAARKRREVVNVQSYTRRRRAVSTGNGEISTAEEPVSNAGASMPVSTAGIVQEASTPSSVAIKDKGDKTVPELTTRSSKRVAEVQLDHEGSKKQKTNEASGSVQEQPEEEETKLIHNRFTTNDDDSSSGRSLYPTNDKERTLWVELKRLFEPDTDDILWKLQRYMHDPLTWRLYDTCGVHQLQVDQYSEMTDELLRKIVILLNRPRHQMSAIDKTGLGYGTQLNELSSNHETDSENSLSIFEARSSDEENTPENDRFLNNGYKVVPPPITGNFLTPRADISFAGLDEYAIKNKIIESQTTELNTKTSKTACQTNDENIKKHDEEEVSEVQTVRPETQTVKTRDDKSGQNSQKQGISFRKVKAYFVCKSTEHLIKDCKFHDKKSQESKLKNVVNTGVLTRIGLNRPSVSTARPVCTARPSVSTARHVCIVRPSVSTARLVCTTRPSVSTARPSVSTARPVCTAMPSVSTARPVYATRPIYPRMDNVRPRGSCSPIKRTVVNTGKGKLDTNLKKSRWVWRPKGNYLDHVSKDSGSFMLKKVEDLVTGSCSGGLFRKDGREYKVSSDYGLSYTHSGCSSHMTGNKAYLSDYEDYNGGFMAFGSDVYSPKDNDVQDSEDVADKEGQHQMTEDEQVLHDELEKMIAQEVVAKALDDATRQAFEEEKIEIIASQKRAVQTTSINKLSTGRSSVSTATTPYVSAASTPTGANAGESSFVYLGGKIPIDASTLPNVDLPIDPNMPNLEDDSDAFSNDGIFNGAYDDENVGAVADFNNMDDTINVIHSSLRIPIREGIDYDEVFAPVARIEAIMLFLAFASYMGFTVYQMDVLSAFLYGTFEEKGWFSRDGRKNTIIIGSQSVKGTKAPPSNLPHTVYRNHRNHNGGPELEWRCLMVEDPMLEHDKVEDTKTISDSGISTHVLEYCSSSTMTLLKRFCQPLQSSFKPQKYMSAKYPLTVVSKVLLPAVLNIAVAAVPNTLLRC
ncbi:putative ribonuclease H-like domain-containing protein [Tanacetum coccineum]